MHVYLGEYIHGHLQHKREFSAFFASTASGFSTDHKVASNLVRDVASFTPFINPGTPSIVSSVYIRLSFWRATQIRSAGVLLLRARVLRFAFFISSLSARHCVILVWLHCGRKFSRLSHSIFHIEIVEHDLQSCNRAWLMAFERSLNFRKKARETSAPSAGQEDASITMTNTP
jgi:hypothetical protein